MTAPAITWRRTFPDSDPALDRVAVFEGRVIGRVYRLDYLPRQPKPWFWGITDPQVSGKIGWGVEQGEKPTREEAKARLIERWRELRALNGMEG